MVIYWVEEVLTLWDQGDLPGPSALTAPSSQPPMYLMVADLSPLHLGGWHLRPSNGSGQSPQGHLIKTVSFSLLY